MDWTVLFLVGSHVAVALVMHRLGFYAGKKTVKYTYASTWQEYLRGYNKGWDEGFESRSRRDGWDDFQELGIGRPMPGDRE